MSVIENTSIYCSIEAGFYVCKTLRSSVNYPHNRHGLSDSISTVQFSDWIDLEQKAWSDKKSIAILCVGDMEMSNAR